MTQRNTEFHTEVLPDYVGEDAPIYDNHDALKIVAEMSDAFFGKGTVHAWGIQVKANEDQWPGQMPRHLCADRYTLRHIKAWWIAEASRLVGVEAKAVMDQIAKAH
jgi:hypothetical protein